MPRSLSRKKRIVLVTGPPNNGRDEYIGDALPDLQKHGKTGYYHVFEYMKEEAPHCDVPHLLRENVFDIPKKKLYEIRDRAFSQIVDKMKNSSNTLEIVSTPSVFKTPIRGDYFDGIVEGLNVELMKKLNPNLLVVFIDDLLRVRARINVDVLRAKLNLKLKDIAESRESSIKIAQEYVYEAKAKSKPLAFMIFARQHHKSTFIDLVLGKKPRIYLSYHITGQGTFKDVERLKTKLESSFVCIDPYAIKDWQIVNAYDEAIRKNKKEVVLKTKEAHRKVITDRLSLDETEEAIDLIRSQIVERDLEVIANVHATVVYHKSDKPSYGVMVEVFHSNVVQRPVYVLYPFRVRLSPFFEHYVRSENMIQGDRSILKLEDTLVRKLKKECKTWSTWSPSREK